MRILRVVTLASSKGTYGGPWDTARRQAEIIAQDPENSVCLMAGYRLGDKPMLRATSGIDADLVEVRSRFRSKGFHTLMSFAFARRLWRRVGEADVVHVSLSRELIPLLTLLAASVRGKRIVAQPHGMLTSRASVIHNFADALLLPMYRRAKVWLALTTFERGDLVRRYGLPPNSIHVLGNPIDLTRNPDELPGEIDSILSDPGVLTVLAISRLEQRKNIREFIMMASQFPRSGLDVRFMLLGPPGPESEYVKEAVERIDCFYYFPGIPPAAVPVALTHANVFVLNSVREPWGNVLAQAIALGVKVLVPGSAALSSLLQTDGPESVYIDGDMPQLIEKLQALLESSGTEVPERVNYSAQKAIFDLAGPQKQKDGLRRAYETALGRERRSP